MTDEVDMLQNKTSKQTKYPFQSLWYDATWDWTQVCRVLCENSAQNWCQDCWMIRSAACRCIKTSSNIFKLNQICFIQSSLVMRHGLLSMIHKPSTRVVRGSQDGRKQDKVIFITLKNMKVSSTASSCHRARQAISKSARKCSGICFIQGMKRDESCGKTNRGSFTMTTYLLIQQFLAERNIASLEQTPYSPDLAPCDFSKHKEIIKRDLFWRWGGHQEDYNRPEEHSRRILPAVFRSMAEKDGKVH